MKIFHTENNREVVYVQLQDIMYVSYETDLLIPASIYKKGLETIISPLNRFQFVRLEDREDVEFFKDLDFIIDYDQYKNLSDEELKKEEKELIEKANIIAEKWNNMTENVPRKNPSLSNTYNNIRYMLNFILEIYLIRHGQSSMPFPYFVNS